MRRAALIAVAVLGVLASGVAMADDDDCTVPMAQWQPREAVAEMAKARGWTVSRIRVDDGCYQIRGQDENGRAFKAKIDPGSLAVIGLKRKGEDHDRSGRRHRDGASRPAPASPTGAPPANGLFGDGAAPKVEIQ
ncbi:MAG: PepSY domain-containing protein [Bosea sp.]|nr:PepSY domain-containing protein [Bosea sp. (in: a-proteobacteria)]OJV06119.1 MAG: hypothetical protein BGO20_09410 [Bosea sp. 67-29]